MKWLFATGALTIAFVVAAVGTYIIFPMAPSCERQRLSRVISPTETFDAIVMLEICSAGPVTYLNSVVQLAHKVAGASPVDVVLVLEPKSTADDPILSWSGENRLLVEIDSLAEINRHVGIYDGVTTEIRRRTKPALYKR